VIPLQEQERLRQYFSERMTGGVKIEHFTQRSLAIVVPGRDDCRFCAETAQALSELRALSPKISLRVHDFDSARGLPLAAGIERVPTTTVRGQLNRSIRFEGFFGASLFPVMVDAIVSASRGATELEARTKRRLQRIHNPIALRLFVSPASPFSAPMMQTVFAFGLESRHLQVTVTDAEEFPRLVETYRVRAVPFTLVGEHVRFAGALPPDALLDQIIKVVEGSTLTVGGGLPGALGPSTPLQGAPETRASPSGLILPGR
jgi:hypothetical protein